MGFCRRCGEITTAERCKCGGHTKESTTRKLFEGTGSATSDKWSQRYLSRSSLAATSSSPGASSSSSALPQPVLGSPSRTLLPPAARPPSPSKLAHSFLQQDDSAGELKSVFGSVLSPKDHWQCCACSVAFKQEEVIYPHPDAKSSVQLAELFFCRQCFAERFRQGNCKKCKRAVLSDAPFIKHDKNLWHEACYSCSYCDNPSTSPVIDFAGRPSCESCFDDQAYLKNGLAPSPHLSQSEFLKAPVSVPPAPSKWGRPSLAPPTRRLKENVWTSTMPPQDGVVGLGVSTSSPSPLGTANSPPTEDHLKPKAWRVQQERDRSPIVSSLNELGDKLRKAGFEDPPRPTSPSKPRQPAASAAARSEAPQSASPPKRKPFPRPSSSSSTTTLRPSSPTKSIAERSALWSAGHSPSLLAPTTKPPSFPIPRSRPVLAPVQPGSARRRALAKDQKPVDSGEGHRAAAVGVESLSALETVDGDLCLVCRKELGFGDFIELPKTGDVIHRGCFTCNGCNSQLDSGKHVEADGKWYHHKCAPPPPRYRAILTALAEPSPPPCDSSAAPSPTDALFTVELKHNDLACTACGQPLGYGTSLTMPRSGKSFHQACFTCAKCEMPLAKGFVEMSGLAYHDKCAPPPASPSPSIRSSPFFAADANSALTSRTSRPISLPSLPSFPPKVAPLASPAASTQPSIFARRPRPPAGLGGLLVCAGCGTRATEKETKQGPLARRYHPRCLACGSCGRSLDSECRVGSDGRLRCESCRKTEARSSYQPPTSTPSRPPALTGTR